MRRDPQGFVFDGAGKDLRAEDFALPSPRADEVLVEITCCTLCGSDLHTFAGHRATPTPTILGHEIVGRIVEVGPGRTRSDLFGRALSPGDRVSWTIAAHCGRCFFCEHDLPQKCERLFKYGHEPLSRTDRGPDSPLSGGLATHCLLVPGTSIARLPDSLSDEVACPANCATATVSAALRVGQLLRGEAIVVMGAGMLGLTAAAMCRSRGADTVLVVDTDSKRLRRASDFGATAVFEPTSAELQRFLLDRTAGRGADLVVELSGATAAAAKGVDLLRIGGRLILVGSVFPVPAMELLPETVVRRMLRIEGVHNYRPDDLKTAIEFLSAEADRYPFGNLVSESFPLSDCSEAFRYALAERPFRVAVRSGE